VEIENIETEERKRYRIVGPDEADISKGYISVLSPIAKALMGKKKGDIALVRAPAGDKEYEIIEISVK